LRQAYDYWQDQPGSPRRRDALRCDARDPASTTPTRAHQPPHGATPGIRPTPARAAPRARPRAADESDASSHARAAARRASESRRMVPLARRTEAPTEHRAAEGHDRPHARLLPILRARRATPRPHEPPSPQGTAHSRDARRRRTRPSPPTRRAHPTGRTRGRRIERPLTRRNAQPRKRIQTPRRPRDELRRARRNKAQRREAPPTTDGAPDASRPKRTRPTRPHRSGETQPTRRAETRGDAAHLVHTDPSLGRCPLGNRSVLPLTHAEPPPQLRRAAAFTTLATSANDPHEVQPSLARTSCHATTAHARGARSASAGLPPRRADRTSDGAPSREGGAPTRTRTDRRVNGPSRLRGGDSRAASPTDRRLHTSLPTSAPLLPPLRPQLTPQTHRL